MEKFQESLAESKRILKIADHIIFITYNVVKDPRLLLSSLKNILTSLTKSMDSLLQYEHLFKRIPALPESFTSKFALFKDHCVKRYNLSQNYLYLIKDIYTLISEHKKSSVEFSRKDKFIICSSNYRMKTVGIPQIKEYLARTKEFNKEIEEIVSKDGIFSKREKKY